VLLSLLSSVCIAVGSTSLVCAVRSVSKTLARETWVHPNLPDFTEAKKVVTVPQVAMCYEQALVGLSNQQILDASRR